MSQQKTGILLINLGTPKSPSTRDVRTYLREFLSDPYVIDLPAIARYILLYCLILPLRPFKSAKAYKKIWTDQGSPLLVESVNLRDQLQKTLGSDYEVVLGMRYQQPSIEIALRKLQQQACDHIILAPLYPQFALSTTQSSLEKVEAILKKINYHPNINTVKPFYDNTHFIDAYASTIKSYHNPQSDCLLFSFHGLPTRHIEKVHCEHTAHCNNNNDCPVVTLRNQNCYRAHCFQTARAIARALELTREQYQVSFQSRLGRTPWIKPYTDETLTQLARAGHKNITIVCPSFVTDCLETLEEIGIAAQEQWQALGGEKLTLVPCLNSDPSWVTALKKIILMSY